MVLLIVTLSKAVLLLPTESGSSCCACTWLTLLAQQDHQSEIPHHPQHWWPTSETLTHPVIAATGQQRHCQTAVALRRPEFISCPRTLS